MLSSQNREIGRKSTGYAVHYLMDGSHRKPLPCSFESSLVILVERVSAVGSAASLHQMKRASCGAFLAFRLKEKPKANSGFRFN